MVGAIGMASSELPNEVCELARHRGLLTRLMRGTVVFMPPLCIELAQIRMALFILEESVAYLLMSKGNDENPSALVA